MLSVFLPGTCNADILYGHDLNMPTNGELSFNGVHFQRDNQQSKNVSANEAVDKSGRSVDTSEMEQSPLKDDFGSEGGDVFPNERTHPLHRDLKREIWEVPIAGSVMPPREEFALRKEMVEFRAEKNVIAVTFANYAFVGFVLSWVKSLTDGGVTNLLVGTFLCSLEFWHVGYLSYRVQTFRNQIQRV